MRARLCLQQRYRPIYLCAETSFQISSIRLSELVILVMAKNQSPSLLDERASTGKRNSTQHDPTRITRK